MVDIASCSGIGRSSLFTSNGAKELVAGAAAAARVILVAVLGQCIGIERFLFFTLVKRV